MSAFLMLTVSNFCLSQAADHLLRFLRAAAASPFRCSLFGLHVHFTGNGWDDWSYIVGTVFSCHLMWVILHETVVFKNFIGLCG